MNINWKVRLKNKNFWLTIVPALALLLQAICKAFGFEFDFSETVNNLLDVVNTAFVALAIFGVVNDPTTVGLSDSERALGYNEPK